MEIALAAIGAILFMSAVNNTTGALFDALKQDIAGSNGFLSWAGLLIVIGIGGRVTGLAVPAKLLMTLLILVYVLKNPKAITTLGDQIRGAQPVTKTEGNADATAGTAEAAQQ
mgnify:CR=1 FL=1